MGLGAQHTMAFYLSEARLQHGVLESGRHQIAFVGDSLKHVFLDIIKPDPQDRYIRGQQCPFSGGRLCCLARCSGRVSSARSLDRGV